MYMIRLRGYSRSLRIKRPMRCGDEGYAGLGRDWFPCSLRLSGEAWTLCKEAVKLNLDRELMLLQAVISGPLHSRHA